jgi:hypothetical protein
MKKGSSQPPPPDYAAAARAQGAANVDTAIAEGVMNRPTTITPYGRSTWVQTGTYNTPGGYEVPQWEQRTEMTDLGQRAFDTQQRVTDSLYSTGERGLNRVGQAFEQPMDYSGVQDLQNRTEQAYMARMNPQFERDEESLRQRMANQGIGLGSEAYAREMDQFGRARTDARQQAILAANQMRPQALQESLAIRNQPLNELNALLSSQQVSVPQFSGAPGASIAPAPIFNATQAGYGAQMQGYNAQQAQQGNMMSGLFGLGGSALMGGLFR